jgi:hypothetical protein
VGCYPAKKNYFVLAIFFQFYQVTSCKSLYEYKNYSTSSAKGVISGDKWSYEYAFTNPEAKLTDGQEIMIVLITGKPNSPCPKPSDLPEDAREVLIAVDGKRGEMKIGASSSALKSDSDAFIYRKPTRSTMVAFLDPSKDKYEQYKFATSGKVKITKISKDTIEGAVVAKVDASMFVNGRFKAKVCNYSQLYD